MEYYSAVKRSKLILHATCWMDLEEIDSGDENFTRKIVPALDGCEVVMFFISADAQKSEWTGKELGYARRHRKRIVPLRFNEDPLIGEFDFLYGDADVIDWRRPEQKEKLLRDLCGWSDELVARPADEAVKKPFAFGEYLIRHLGKRLPRESFRAVAGLEFHYDAANF